MAPYIPSDKTILPNLTILASGSGTTFENLIKCQAQMQVNINKLITDRPCNALKIANQYNIPSWQITYDKYSKDIWSASCFEVASFSQPTLIILAGFLRKLIVPDEFAGYVLNIHPSYLPKFGGKGMYGKYVHERVIASKEKYSGCTVHIVDNEYDHGEIIAQVKVPISKYDDAVSLEQKIKIKERALYPKAIRNYLKKVINR